MKPARIGAAVGGISIAFSTLCFVVMPAFTAALILAILCGAISGSIALGLKARRSAMVAFVFALTPLGGFLMLEHVVERVHNGYVMFVPLGLAFMIAVWVLRNYLKTKSSVASASA